MTLLHTLAAIGRFIRRTPPPPADLLEAYAHEVIPVLDRAEWLYAYWLEQSTLFTDGEKLGNVAAIHRWETATMGRSLERVIPPAVLAGAHERVIDALDLASRAAQLLSNGSRFHNANAVCEGQAMLAVSRERRLAALKSMRRYLSRVQLAASSEAEATSSELLAEAAAVATRGDEPTHESLPAAPAADGAPSDAPGSEAALVSVEPPVVVNDADLGAWPEQPELDLIVTDAAEPVPAWLTAARPEAGQAETSEPRSDEQVDGRSTAEQAALAATEQTERDDAARSVDASIDAPVVTPAADSPSPDPSASERSARSGGTDDDPPERAGWGSLFARPPGQSDR